MNRWQRSRFLLYWWAWTDQEAAIFLGISRGEVVLERKKIEIFNLYWKDLTDEQLSGLLGETHGQIRWRRHMMKRHKRHRWTTQEMEEIQRNALTLTDQDQAEDFGVSVHQLRGARRKLDIKIQRPAEKRVPVMA